MKQKLLPLQYMSTAFLTISGIPTSITVRSVQLHIRLDSLMNSGDYSGFPGGSDGKESACNVGDPGSIPGLGRSPGEWNGNLLQYSCLENFIDRGAWRAIFHGIANSQTQLSNYHFHFQKRVAPYI